MAIAQRESSHSPHSPNPLGTSSPIIGRVVGLWRYPVKSMAGEPISEADVSWHGFAGDRRWAFVRPGVPESGFPWLTLRERADMARYRPSFIDPNRPDRSATSVRSPSGTIYDITDPLLARELSAGGAQLVRYDRGIFDTFPLSLVTTQSIAELSKLVGRTLEVERFRPNILIEAVGTDAFPEDAWIGYTVRLGEMRFRIDKRDGRCAVITIDPANGERDPSVLRAVAQERDGCLGVYGTTVQPGRIAVGDVLHLERTG